MRYDLAALAARATNRRRRTVTFRPIVPTSALAANLYAATYKPVIATLTLAMPHLLAVYERALPVRDAIHDAAADDVQSVMSSLSDTLNRLLLTLVPGLRTWAAQTERWHRAKWRAATLTATGMDIDTLLLASGQPQSVGDTIAWNVRLVKDVSDQAQGRMSNAIFAAFTARKPVRDLAADLRGIIAVSRRRALGIAADQVSKLSAALDTERMVEAGIEQWRYRHSGKHHARLWHLRRDGRLFDMATNREVDGADVIEPGDGPGQPPFCGCRKQAVLSF